MDDFKYFLLTCRGKRIGNCFYAVRRPQFKFDEVADFAERRNLFSDNLESI